MTIRPQPGFQEDYLSSSADIVIGGGSAGAGKTYALLMEPLRHMKVAGFAGVVFRRITKQITNPGGLWDTVNQLYLPFGYKANQTDLSVKYYDKKSKRPLSKLKFSHLQYESDVLGWQGSQIPFIGFDELTHFTRNQFLYLLSRNRSNCGVRSYVRATCNPDPDSWVAELLEWWIDQDTGFPIPERCGVIRYFTADKDHYVWGDTVEEVLKKCPHIFNDPALKDRDPKTLIKSITFIPGSVYENKKLLDNDPGYLGSLLALDDEEKDRLLEGNWKIRLDGSSLFNYNKIMDLFSNFLPESDEMFITCDVARFGRDLTVIITWKGYKIVRIEILTKSGVTDIFNAIENERERTHIPRSKVLVDEDGVGGGVVDLSDGQYNGFNGGAQPYPNPLNPDEGKENYKNLKTQCFYRTADNANNASISIDLNNIIVDGVPSDHIKFGKKEFTVKQLIVDQLRAIKKKDMDKEGKKQINSKEEQKNILNGMSPDFADAISMRSWFEVAEPPQPGIFFV